MAVDFSAAQRKLTMTDTYVADVGVAGAGFMIPYVVDNLLDRFAPFDSPNEVAGLATIAGVEMFGFGGYERAAQAGAGVYVADQAAQRFGVKSTVTSLGSE